MDGANAAAYDMNASLPKIGVHLLKTAVSWSKPKCVQLIKMPSPRYPSIPATIVSQCVQDCKTQYSILCSGEVQKYNLWGECWFFISTNSSEDIMSWSGAQLWRCFCLLQPPLSNYCITCWRASYHPKLASTTGCLRLVWILLFRKQSILS